MTNTRLNCYCDKQVTAQTPFFKWGWENKYQVLHWLHFHSKGMNELSITPATAAFSIHSFHVGRIYQFKQWNYQANGLYPHTVITSTVYAILIQCVYNKYVNVTFILVLVHQYPIKKEKKMPLKHIYSALKPPQFTYFPFIYQLWVRPMGEIFKLWKNNMHSLFNLYFFFFGN